VIRESTRITQRYREEGIRGYVKGKEKGIRKEGNPSGRRGGRGQISEYFFIETYLRLEYYFAAVPLLCLPSLCQVVIPGILGPVSGCD
jgi:hypothetical protein